MISLSQRPLPDNTQDPQETDVYAQAGYELSFPTNNPLQTRSFDRAGPGIGNSNINSNFFLFPPGATTPIGGCILQPSSGL